MEDHSTDGGFYAQWMDAENRFQESCRNFRPTEARRIVSDASVLVGLAAQYINWLRAENARLKAD